jgi:glutathione peroxidase-family protein
MWDKVTLKRKGSLILGMNQLLGNEKQKQTEEQKKQADKLYSVKINLKKKHELERENAEKIYERLKLE